MIRNALLAFSIPFTFLATPALAGFGPSDCIGRLDPVAAKRCADYVVPKPLQFWDYPAQAYGGPVHLPDYTGESRKYAFNRRLVSLFTERGPNFAGHLSLIPFGCGGDCQGYMMADLSDGTISPFMSDLGDEVKKLRLEYQAGSTLVLARWVEGDRCFRAFFNWDGQRFETLQRRDIGPSKRCGLIERVDYY